MHGEQTGGGLIGCTRARAAFFGLKVAAGVARCMGVGWLVCTVFALPAGGALL